MLRRFSDDLVQDREFEFGGELLKWVYPHWEDGAAIFDETLVPATNGDGPEEPAFSFKTDTEKAIYRIPYMLDVESGKKFKALAARKKPEPVPRHQIVALYRWLVEVTSGLPTQAPSELGTEAQDTDTSSPAGSSSKAAT